MTKGKRLSIKSGDAFGRLTIIEESEVRNKHRYFVCRCECGNVKEVKLDSLTRGVTISCGCYNREISSSINSVHGMCSTRLYRIWSGMKARCHYPKHKGYSNYGGRGISICDEWDDFSNFRDWALKNGYLDHLTIDRTDVNGDYRPENCTWKTMDYQRRHTRKSRQIEFDGKIMTMRQWAEKCGLDNSTISRRLKDGWSVEKTLTTPPYARSV